MNKLQQLLFVYGFRSLLLRLLLSLVIVIVVPLTTVIYLDSFYSRSIIEEKISTLRSELIDKHQQFIDALLKDMDKKILNISGNNKLFNPTESVDLLSRDLYYAFVNDNNTLCCIDSIEIYYKNHAARYSIIQGLVSLEPLTNSKKSEYEELSRKGYHWFIDRVSDRDDKPMVSLIRTIPTVGVDINGFIKLNVDSIALMKSPFRTSEGKEIWVVSPDGYHIFDTKTGGIIPYDQNRGIYKRIQQGDLSFEENYNQAHFHFRLNESSKTGWKYIFAVNDKWVSAGNNQNKLIFIMAAALSMISVGVYIYFLSRRISGTFQALYSSNKKHGLELENAKRESLPAMKLAMMSKLLDPSQVIGEKEIIDSLEKLGITITPFGCFVVLLRIDNYAKFLSKYSRSDQSLLRFFIEKLTEEVASEDYNVITVNSESRDIILFVNSKIEASIELTRTQAIVLTETMLEHIHQYLDITCSAALGGKVSSLTETSLSYSQALLALETRMIKGYGLVLTSWDLPEDRPILSSMYPFRKSMEEELASSIRKNDPEGIKQLIQKLNNHIEHHGQYSPDILQHHMLEIMVAAAYCFIELGGRQKVNLELPQMSKKISELETVDAICTWMENKLLFWMDDLSTKNELKPNVIQHVVDYIHNNFDQDISLSGISEQLGMDISYLSRLFKQETGKKFIDYLISLRIERAKQMLLHTNLNVQDISQAVGYSTNNSFIRVFKKYVGVTPGQYREQNLEKRMLDDDKVY